MRVAVGLGGGERPPAEPAATAGPVLDGDRFAQRDLQVPREQARRDVGAAAGGVGHDQGQAALGISRLCRDRMGQRRDRERWYDYGHEFAQE